MMREEKMQFYAVTTKLVEEYGCDGCAHCPYRERCLKEDLYFGCGVWEEQMGEDL